MRSKNNTRLDWCSHAAAEYAVRHWHYSGGLPTPPHNIIGVWEQQFIGVVIFSRGANRNLGTPYGLPSTECCELTRIALHKHTSPVSRIVKIAIKLLRARSPGLRLVVSFADPNHGHSGAIYQAGNWMFSGETSPSKLYVDSSGRQWHPRMVKTQGYTKCYGRTRKTVRPSECSVVEQVGKLRYLMPLDADMRRQIEPLRKPYPKRAGSVDSGTLGDQPGRGGAIPTSALSIRQE